MFQKVISFHDIAENYIRMNYKTTKKGGMKLFVRSKYGDYVRIWDRNDEVIQTTFKSQSGFILVDDE